MLFKYGMEMQISSYQCRAARSLLGWSQDELAINARVARATIADFEGNLRVPIRNNLNSIRDCLYAAGVQFLQDEGELGAGVRFRERKIEFVKNVYIDSGRDRAKLRMRYDGVSFDCFVSREAIEDRFQWSTSRSDKEFASAVSDVLHEILAIVEQFCKKAETIGDVLITSQMLNNS